MVSSNSGISTEKATVERSPFFISVVIVNFNGLHYLERLFRSLAAQTYPTFEIIFVDNASTDGSAECLAASEWGAVHNPNIRIIRSTGNLGFAAGNNLGIRAAKGELFATLNTDTEVEPNYLEKLAAPMRDAQVGSCAPLMLQFARRERVDAAGVGVDRAGFAWNREADKNARVVAGVREVFGACAGAALYRRTMLDAIGLFDDEYFAFYEDVDLAWRAQRARWKCMLVPEARVYHIHGGSFREGSPQKLFLLARNRWWTVLKNYPMPALVFFLPLILAADFLALLRALFVYHSLAPLRGRVAAWSGIMRAFGKRRAVRRYSLTGGEAA